MSNLIPTPRTDKNGVTVVRHMKPETATSAKGSQMLPPVTLATPQDHDALTSRATEVFTDMLGGFSPEHHDKLHAILGTYSNITLDRVRKHDWTPNEASDLNTIITEGEWDRTAKAFIMWDETKINDYLVVSQAIREQEPDGIPHHHHNSWNSYPELHPVDNIDDYPEERLSQLVALYTVTAHMTDQGHEGFSYSELTKNTNGAYLEPSPLRELIMNPGPKYNREDITSIITTHDTFDPERIKAMLDLDNPSLRDGVL